MYVCFDELKNLYINSNIIQNEIFKQISLFFFTIFTNSIIITVTNIKSSY
jgi:hypothetical protein